MTRDNIFHLFIASMIGLLLLSLFYYGIKYIYMGIFRPEFRHEFNPLKISHSIMALILEWLSSMFGPVVYRDIQSSLGAPFFVYMRLIYISILEVQGKFVLLNFLWREHSKPGLTWGPRFLRWMSGPFTAVDFLDYELPHRQNRYGTFLPGLLASPAGQVRKLRPQPVPGFE
jgi:cbb3-type cytochrome oxidase subunit 3